jgi:hypothetical protein
MLLANKEAVMTVLDTLNFVAFNPLQNNNPIAVRRRKLIAKIDEQIQLAANKAAVSVLIDLKRML